MRPQGSPFQPGSTLFARLPRMPGSIGHAFKIHRWAEASGRTPQACPIRHRLIKHSLIKHSPISHCCIARC